MKPKPAHPALGIRYLDAILEIAILGAAAYIKNRLREGKPAKRVK